MAASKKHESLRGDRLEREAQEDIRQGKIAAAVAGPELRADGSGDSEEDSHATSADDQLQADDTDMTDDTDIQTGDVCIDLAQGRPVHVVEDTGQTALDWSNENGYDLLENYGNRRFGSAADDRVFNVVYLLERQKRAVEDVRIPRESVDAGRDRGR
ncbi:hypothetical protein [Natrinema ejinorense]|uniref:hypothetical protein n=1 Tax=Natrinema ejinorense TaxID=373386 RepID=UPI0026BAD194